MERFYGPLDNAEIDASIDVQNRVANGIKSPAVLVPNGKKRKKRASARIVVPEPPSRQFDPVAERLEDLWIGFRQRIAKEFDEESWLLLRHGWSLLGKLFKNPISERWGKQICLN